MDIRAKRLIVERIRRALTRRLNVLGFTRGKTTFWVRPKNDLVEFIHVHLFTFMPAFRVHAGIRVLNDSLQGAALNGPSSGECFPDGKRHYNLEYRDDGASVASCVNEMFAFCVDVAEPWFESLSTERLLSETNSPLIERQRLELAAALRGQADPRTLALSRKLLGVV